MRCCPCRAAREGAGDEEEIKLALIKGSVHAEPLLRLRNFNLNLKNLRLCSRAGRGQGRDACGFGMEGTLKISKFLSPDSTQILFSSSFREIE